MAQTRLKGFPLRIWDGSFSQISRKMSWERGLFWSVAYAHAQRHNRLLSTSKSKKVKLDCHVSAVSIKHFVAFQATICGFFTYDIQCLVIVTQRKSSLVFQYGSVHFRHVDKALRTTKWNASFAFSSPPSLAGKIK